MFLMKEKYFFSDPSIMNTSPHIGLYVFASYTLHGYMSPSEAFASALSPQISVCMKQKPYFSYQLIQEHTKRHSIVRRK
jgi:hypothetical protein